MSQWTRAAGLSSPHDGPARAARALELLVGIAKGRRKEPVPGRSAGKPLCGAGARRIPLSGASRGHSLGFIGERRLMMRMTPLVRERLRPREFFHATKYVHVESILKRGLLAGWASVRAATCAHASIFPRAARPFRERAAPGGGGRRTDADAVIHTASANVMGEGSGRVDHCRRSDRDMAQNPMVHLLQDNGRVRQRAARRLGRRLRRPSARPLSRGRHPWPGRCCFWRRTRRCCFWRRSHRCCLLAARRTRPAFRAMQTGAHYTLGRVSGGQGPGDEPEEPGAPRYTQAAKRARWVLKCCSWRRGGAGWCCFRRREWCCFRRREWCCLPAAQQDRSTRRHMFMRRLRKRLRATTKNGSEPTIQCPNCGRTQRAGTLALLGLQCRN